MAMIAQLLMVCTVALIQVTTSQFTYDAIQQYSGVDSCQPNEQEFRQLMSAVSQLQKTVSRLESHITGTGRNTGDTDVQCLAALT